MRQRWSSRCCGVSSSQSMHWNRPECCLEQTMVNSSDRAIPVVFAFKKLLCIGNHRRPSRFRFITNEWNDMFTQRTTLRDMALEKGWRAGLWVGSCGCGASRASTAVSYVNQFFSLANLKQFLPLNKNDETSKLCDWSGDENRKEQSGRKNETKGQKSRIIANKMRCMVHGVPFYF